MAGLTSIIGGTIGSLASAIYGGVKSSQYNNKARGIVGDMVKDNKAWYDTRMSQDYTARADVQAAINRQRQILDEQYRNAKAANVVAGGTDAQLALQKEAANRATAQVTTDIASQANAYKDRVEDQYRAQDAALKQQQAQSYQQQAAATAQAASQAVDSGLNLVGQGVNIHDLDKAGVLKEIV